MLLADAPGRELLQRRGPVVPIIIMGPARTIRTLALIDTGSTITSVDREQLLLAGARQVGSTLVETVTTSATIPTYAIRLGSDDGHILVDGSPVLGDHLQPPVQALIGRDVMARCRFGYDGPGGAFILNEHGADWLRRALGAAAFALGAIAAYELVSTLMGRGRRRR